jgi:hypothetical protein
MCQQASVCARHAMQGWQTARALTGFGVKSQTRHSGVSATQPKCAHGVRTRMADGWLVDFSRGSDRIPRRHKQALLTVLQGRTDAGVPQVTSFAPCTCISGDQRGSVGISVLSYSG